MITIDRIAFSYGKTPVLKDISMKLESGRIYGLLGENGVGKTTLLTLLCGLKKPDAGTIDIDGQCPFRRKPGFLASEFYLGDEVVAHPVKASAFAKENGKFRFCSRLSTGREHWSGWCRIRYHERCNYRSSWRDWLSTKTNRGK